MRITIISFISVLFFLSTFGWGEVEAKSRANPEKFYRNKYCLGQIEVTLDDNIKHKRAVRCDCLTDSHAIEFDFGDKWAQAVGQSLYYSYLTRKKAGVYLIIERPRDMGLWLL